MTEERTEPTVLEYVKSQLNIRQSPSPASPASATPPSEPRAPTGPREPFPWRSLGAFVLALVAQLFLEAHQSWQMGALLYILAFLWLLLMADWRGEWRAVLAPEKEQGDPQPGYKLITPFRVFLLLMGVLLAYMAYRAFGTELFNQTNTTLWVLSLAAFMAAFWVPEPAWLQRTWAKVLGWLKHPYTHFSGWALLLIAVGLVAVYFRANLINEVPSQMNSDHAEKLLDVWDVLHGQTRVFFPRNTGREAFQFHYIAATSLIFKTGVSFLSMKIGAILAGLLVLPFIYLIGKEIGNRWVGLLAMAFAGVAYWPNVIARLALRFTFYPFFAAPTLYFFIRGLRRKSRNDLLITGLLLGLGLHSYTPIRILPVVIVVGVVLYMLHQRSWQVQRRTFVSLAMLTLIAVVGFIPLLRYIANPLNREMFLYRAMTRVGTVEQPLPDKPWKILVSNTWNAMRMFGWDNGEVWTVSVPHRPALDPISACLCYLGMGVLFIRYLRKRNWLDLFLLLSVPMLMLPSILSLAFPAENPVLSRTSGALIPVFLMVGIALESFLSVLWKRFGPRWGRVTVVGLGLILFALAANKNYDLVFREYRQLYDQSSWNSSEMGAVYHDFATTIGTRDTFWLVGYAYWVDSRLISINAGYPDRDCAIMPPDLAATLTEPRAKLFVLNPLDTASLGSLQQLYPTGVAQTYKSSYEGRDFIMFFVPPQASN